MLRAKITRFPHQPTGMTLFYRSELHCRGRTDQILVPTLLGHTYQSARSIFRQPQRRQPCYEDVPACLVPISPPTLTLSDNFSAKHRARFYVAIYRHSYQAADLNPQILTVSFYIRHLTAGNHFSRALDQSAYTLPLEHLEFRRFNRIFFISAQTQRGPANRE